MTYRFIDEGALLKQLSGAAQDRAAAWLRDQRSAPQLVSATRAASLLGVKPPHISRLRDQGRMPEPIPVEGGNDAYLLSEVQALARDLQAERAERARKRVARDSATTTAT